MVNLTAEHVKVKYLYKFDTISWFKWYISKFSVTGKRMYDVCNMFLIIDVWNIRVDDSRILSETIIDSVWIISPLLVQ